MPSPRSYPGIHSPDTPLFGVHLVLAVHCIDEARGLQGFLMKALAPSPPTAISLRVVHASVLGVFAIREPDLVEVHLGPRHGIKPNVKVKEHHAADFFLGGLAQDDLQGVLHGLVGPESILP